ncbi:MAG TPA: chorismate lyase [Gammaproteobacteria bacterium]
MSKFHTRLNWYSQQHCLHKRISAPLRNWLFDRGSLTARLVDLCGDGFSVRLVSLRRASPAFDEIIALGMQPRAQALVREVLLCCDNKPLVYARTIIPVSSMRGALRGLALLGTRPLGAVLFSDPSMTRQPLEVALLHAAHVYHERINNLTEEPVWGRRSVFTLKGEKLLVSEFFLPELFDKPDRG